VKLNKRKLLKKLVSFPTSPTRLFWAKEFKLLNDLLEKFPDTEFWNKATFKPVPSVAILLSTELTNLKRQYDMFFFQPQIKEEKIQLGEATGENYNIVVKHKTLRNFLND
jgi:hypothetical protein